MRKYIVIKKRRSEFETPVSISKGEEVMCLEESNPDGDWAGWVLCKTKDNEGWIPHQIIEREDTYGKMMEDYYAIEFNLNIGEVLITEKELNGWIWCYKEGVPDVKAWAPLNCIELII